MDTNEKPFPIITERFAVPREDYDEVLDLSGILKGWSFNEIRVEAGQDVFEISQDQDDGLWRIFWYSPLPGRRTTFTLKELVDMFNLLSETTRLRIDLVVV